MRVNHFFSSLCQTGGMKQVFVFDVDGTLTGPRRVMYEDFTRFFRAFARSNPVYLVSGSDYGKLEEQLPAHLLDEVQGVFACSGNELRQQGQLRYQMTHEFPAELLAFAQQFVDESAYPVRTGNHLEPRVGALNVSVVGRNATPGQRNDYQQFDHQNLERQRLIDALNSEFSEYEANSGGQISVDVSPRGWNKARVCREVAARHPDAVFHFFGDNIQPGGNDMPLAEAFTAHSPENCIYPVKDHFETWKVLQERFAGLDASVSV